MASIGVVYHAGLTCENRNPWNLSSILSRKYVKNLLGMMIRYQRGIFDIIAVRGITLGIHFQKYEPMDLLHDFSQENA